MTIYVKHLAYEERAVYGTCPVCDAQPGQRCRIIRGEELTENNLGPGAHMARLVNAPHTAAVSDIGERHAVRPAG